MSKPRVNRPVRNQAEMVFTMPEDALLPEHPARVLWSVFEKLDLSRILVDARAFEGGSGRATTCPRMLLTPWTYAISRGVGSAREIERLTSSDVGYRWMVGDQRPSRATLSRFRVEHLEALDDLLTDILAALMEQGALSLKTVAVDGIRVRASASAPSFRREASLQALREQASLHLRAVLAQKDDPSLTARHKAVCEAKARDFAARVEAALCTVHELEENRRSSQKPPRARLSHADPEAG
jgi:transposase